MCRRDHTGSASRDSGYRNHDSGDGARGVGGFGRSVGAGTELKSRRIRTPVSYSGSIHSPRLYGVLLTWPAFFRLVLPTLIDPLLPASVVPYKRAVLKPVTIVPSPTRPDRVDPTQIRPSQQVSNGPRINEDQSAASDAIEVLAALFSICLLSCAISNSSHKRDPRSLTAGEFAGE